jgi:hypothetical protein
MSDIQTKQKQKKKIKAIDLAAILAKPLDEKPKSLAECLEEAGGFPFRAVAVATIDALDNRVLPVGAEILATELIHTGTYTGRYKAFTDLVSRGVAMNTEPKRWKLLGHL